jgi:phenylacetate-CoA ligase
MSRDAEPDDAERFPTLTEAGARMLRRLREHPAAPIFRNRSGNRLTVADLEAVQRFEDEVRDVAVEWVPGRVPDWVRGVVAECYAHVPAFRARGTPPPRFEDIPSTRRADLSADIAAFVPDTVPIDRLINFRTTGTTGHPMLIASHPQVAARYLSIHKRALRRFGVTLRHGRDQVGVVLLGHQRQCFTYVSVTPQMGESGLVKLNLHPVDWQDPDHRATYLDALEAEIYAGDPISFAELLRLQVRHRPRALISVSMALSPALRARLEDRFACPVLDIYSLNEVGAVAVFDPALDAHVLLQPRLYVEVLDASDRILAPGERGEITVTGGFNFCLPLLRYRTGDFGALVAGPGAPCIRALGGRRPVRFRNLDGEWFNNIDVSHALARVPLSHYGFHQAADGALTLSLRPAERALHSDAAAQALRPLFGVQPVRIETLDADDKVLQYRSDLPDAEIA